MNQSLICLAISAVSLTPGAAATRPVAEWRFESDVAPFVRITSVLDTAAKRSDAVVGNAWAVRGVSGNGLQLDGITAHIVRPAADAPRLGGPFTFEAWIAIAAYPFNWCPLLQQQEGEKAGFFFGIGDRGQVTFRLAAGGKWQAVETAERIPLRQWAFVAAAYDGARATVYINGHAAGSVAVSGDFIPASAADLRIGRNLYDLEQTMEVSPNRQYPARILFDGILDEVSVSEGAKTEAELAAAYARLKPSAPPPIEARALPAGPPGPGRFGATYGRLKYYKGWDEMWRVGDYPDVVVRFDQAAYRFVFWRGTSYIPHWVTENGIWYDNEFTESFQRGLRGSAEPMSDKICKFSNVRIVESNDARVVVHWRYAPVDVNYTFANVDPLTGWGDWTDEVFTIYPDGIGVRDITVHTSGPPELREWHEGIVVMGPGMSPANAIEPAGLTLINSEGASRVYSWEKETPPRKPAEPARANTQIINTRSRYKPFASVRPQDQPWFDVYAGEIRREVSIYPWWNHWPTAIEPSNGRYALAADRASHSSLTHIHWNEIEKGEKWLRKVMLHGLTDKPAAEVAAISRSWSDAPKTAPESRYSPMERAYIFERMGGRPLEFTVQASAASPLRNLAVVVHGWGEADAQLMLDGKGIARGTKFRVGHRTTVDASDLVVWIQMEATQPVKVALR